MCRKPVGEGAKRTIGARSLRVLSVIWCRLLLGWS
jgi:hypothetical protein